MKKRLVQGFVLAGLTVLLLAGCAFAPLSILGTWTHIDGVESVDFTLTKFTLTDLLGGGGTWECSLDKVNAGEQQIKMTTTATTGSLAGFSPDGQEWYLYYTLVSGELKIGLDTVDYPPTAWFGPYLK